MKRLFLALLLIACVHNVHTLEAKIHRSSSARHHFMVQTGYPHGRPGWIVDHVIPLCAGGIDAPSNMQWQTVEDAKAKDRLEKALCSLERAADKARAKRSRKDSHAKIAC